MGSTGRHSVPPTPSGQLSRPEEMRPQSYGSPGDPVADQVPGSPGRKGSLRNGVPEGLSTGRQIAGLAGLPPLCTASGPAVSDRNTERAVNGSFTGSLRGGERPPKQARLPEVRTPPCKASLTHPGPRPPILPWPPLLSAPCPVSLGPFPQAQPSAAPDVTRTWHVLRCLVCLPTRVPHRQPWNNAGSWEGPCWPGVSGGWTDRETPPKYRALSDFGNSCLSAFPAI